MIKIVIEKSYELNPYVVSIFGSSVHYVACAFLLRDGLNACTIVVNMWLGFTLWLVTRGIIAFIVILIAGIYATLTNHVPLVLNDILLWCLRVYGLPDSNKGKLPEGTRIAVFDHPTFFDHSVLMQYFGRPLRFLTKMSHLSTWPLESFL